jgi:Helix-turn-helix
MHPPQRNRMRHYSAATLREAARLLFPATPNYALAKALGHKRSTVRSWLSGHRRPPVEVLRQVQELVRLRQIACSDCVQDLGLLVQKREWEPRRPLQGICKLRAERSLGPRDGDGRGIRR